ncbi:unnamed protein product [Meganyctiphanes norvegica]|uniref:Transporter n=1 Tax=Meganyctiphanes norvegica TaxID=48144 RepID=A0AAV2RT94_MEGNR
MKSKIVNSAKKSKLRMTWTTMNQKIRERKRSKDAEKSHGLAPSRLEFDNDKINLYKSTTMGKEDSSEMKKEAVKAMEVSGEQPEEEEERGEWSNQFEFFLSCVGYAVGIGNVWRFPYLAYKNGGAAFLIPYVTMLLCAGLPLFFMELALGQYVSLGPNVLFGQLSPIFSGLGWAMIMVTLLTAVHYNMILCWTFFYTFASFSAPLPWSDCSNDFNSIGCYTREGAEECRNQSLFFYNNSCVNSAEYCESSGYPMFNVSHCTVIEDSTNESMTKPAESVAKRIIAADDYFTNRMLGVTGTTWDDMGSMRWELVGCLFLAWLVVAAALAKGVKSSGKVVYFTAIYPYVVLFILFVRGITLPGAYKGIEFYILKPDIARLGEINVWREAATQIFYSLSSSFGGLITLASYNKFKNNCMRDAILVSFINCGTSVFAGFAVFSILGFLATELGVEIEDVVESGTGLAFIVFPAAVMRMPFPTIWAILFFTMLITLGLDSQFTFVETLTSAAFDDWPRLRKNKEIVVFGMCFVMFLLGLTMCLQGGIYMFELFFTWSAGLSVLFIAIVEVTLVSYVFGFRNFMKLIQEEMGIYVPTILYGYWGLMWCVITPLSLSVIFVMSCVTVTKAQYGDYVFPDNIQVLAWLLLGASIILIPIFALYQVLKGNYVGKELFMPTENFCPAHVRKLRETNGAATKGLDDGVLRFTYDNQAFQQQQDNNITDNTKL